LLFRFKLLAAVGVGMLVGAVVGIRVVAVGIGAAEAVSIGVVVGIGAAEAVSIGVVVGTAGVVVRTAAAVGIEAAEVASMTSKSPNAARIADCSSAAAESTNLMALSALSLQSVGH